MSEGGLIPDGPPMFVEWDHATCRYIVRDAPNALREIKEQDER